MLNAGHTESADDAAFGVHLKQADNDSKDWQAGAQEYPKEHTI